MHNSDSKKKLLRLKQEEEYRRQIYEQHKYNLQDAWDNMLNLRSCITTFQQSIDAVTAEESLEQALSASVLSYNISSSSAIISNASTVSQSPTRRSYETFPAFAATATVTTPINKERMSDWKVEGGVTLFDVLSGRSNIYRATGERANAFKARLLKRLAHIRYLENQLQEELEEKAQIAKLALEQVTLICLLNCGYFYCYYIYVS